MTSTDRDQTKDASIGQGMGKSPNNLIKNTALLLPGPPFIHCLISFSITALCGLVIDYADHRVFIVGLCAYGLAWFVLVVAKIWESFLYLGIGVLLSGPLLTVALYFLLPHFPPEYPLNPVPWMFVSLAAFALALPDFASGLRLLEDGLEKVMLGILSALEKTRYAQWSRKIRSNLHKVNQQNRQRHQEFL